MCAHARTHTNIHKYMLTHTCTHTRTHAHFFFCVRCDDPAKSSGTWLLGSPPFAVFWQLPPPPPPTPSASLVPTWVSAGQNRWCTAPGVGRSEECAQEFAPRSHIHSRLNQQDLTSSDIFFTHSDQYVDPVKGVNLVFLWVISIVFQSLGFFCFCFRRVLTSLYEVERWGLGNFAAAFASLSAVSFSAMPT